MSLSPEFPAFSPWSASQQGAAQVPQGDGVSAHLSWSESIGDDVAQDHLRCAARALADGTDLSRLDQHQLLELLLPRLVDGRPQSGLTKPLAYRLVPVVAPVSAPAPAPAANAAASPRTMAAAPPPAPADSTFAPNLDVVAMVAALRAAAQDGVPFCEECARAAINRQVNETAAA